MSKAERKLLRRRLANAYLSSVISITLVLLLVGVAAFVIVNSAEVSRYLRENMTVSVLMVQNTSEEQAEQYAESVSSLPYVRSTHVVSREEGEAQLKELLGEDFLSVFATSPVPVSVDITLHADYVVADSLDFVTQVLSGSPLVEEVDSQQDLVGVLNENIARISLAFAVLILLLLFVSVVLINNMVRVSVYARRFSVHTMKLVGATKAFIRKPFMYAAAKQAAVAAVLASLALSGLWTAAKRSFEALFEVFSDSSLWISVVFIFVFGFLICLVSTRVVVDKLVDTARDELYY